jgi:predicted nuclease of predicted toxin-antitoxin system
MRFLIDNALSPVFASQLVAEGHEAVHLRSLGLQDASDDVVFALARDQDRILVSADTDFGTLLAMREQNRPSVILFRHCDERDPVKQCRLLLRHLEQLAADLQEGALAVIEPHRIRIRMLPM